MRVLLVEDDAALAHEVATGLRARGFGVDAVGSRADASLAVAVNSYDCLVVDRTLPDGDGLDLVATLRQDGARTPVLMLTARDAVPDRVDGFARGADDYVVKPFAFAELTARIIALCRRTELPRPSVLHIGDVVVDVARRRVTRAGVILTVGPKEFAVLEHLVVNAGRVVSRSELIEHCWDEMSDPMSNVVDAVVVQIRRKLGKPTLVHTVRGEGFVIDPTP